MRTLLPAEAGNPHSPEMRANPQAARGYLEGALRGPAVGPGRAAQPPPPHPPAGTALALPRAAFPPPLPPRLPGRGMPPPQLPWQRPRSRRSSQTRGDGAKAREESRSHQHPPGAGRARARPLRAPRRTSILSPMQVAMAPAALPRVPIPVVPRAWATVAH